MNFYGLFGYPLGHSISPLIHQVIYQTANITAAYKTFEIQENQLNDALQAMTLLNIRGANVTIPYKQAFIPLLDSISPLAERLQAVNTIKQVDGRLEGYNTDYEGIALTFEQKNWQVKNKKVSILGSGGASQAAAHYFSDHEASSITIVSRSAGSKDSLWPTIDYEMLRNQAGDILVNCTPVGMYPKVDASPVDKKIIQDYQLVFDMTYNPVETLLLKWAKELGKEYTNGLDMLVGQAIRSVEIWEEQKFDDDQINTILEYFRQNWKGVS